MNEQRDEKWLDELVSENIDTSEPKFDAEKWKKKYPGEFQALVGRSSQRSSASQIGVLSIVLNSRIAKFAAAAVLIVGIGLFLAYLGPGEQEQGNDRRFAKSPAEMVTAMSLRMAYRQGGMEALGKQCDEAARVLGPSKASPSLADLLTELNG